MSKFSLVINDDCTAAVSVGGKELTDVRRIMIYGEPLHLVVSIKQYEKNENNCYFLDENGERIATKTRMIEFYPEEVVE